MHVTNVVIKSSFSLQIKIQRKEKGAFCLPSRSRKELSLWCCERTEIVDGITKG